MEKLKPCPFCGGGGIPIDVFNGVFTVRCGKCGVSCPDGTLYIKYSEAEAVEAWNSRYERTCHNADKTGIAGRFECSECGWIEADEPIYCGGCGAKVVG